MWPRLTAPLLVSILALPAGAAETIHLVTGFDLRAESHTVQGDNLILLTSTGTIQISSAQVAGIEIVPDPPLRRPERQAVASQLAHTPADLLHSAARAQGNAPEFDRLVRSVAMVESGWKQSAVSPRGAIGLMQLMPSTAKDLRVLPSDASQNAEGGARLLAQLLERFHYDSVLALAAYNAGVASVQRYGGVPPFAETQAYVRRVLKVYAQLTAAEVK